MFRKNVFVCRGFKDNIGCRVFVNVIGGYGNNSVKYYWFGLGSNLLW